MDLKLGDTQEIIKQAGLVGLLRNELAYVLATAYHETGHTMKPVKEAFWLSEDWRKTHLRYYPWYGRGYVQLTWESNYKKAALKTGIAMDKNPELALEPVAASKVLIIGMKEGWFTGKKLSDYFSIQKSDFVGARHMINGSDKDVLIAGYASSYDTELKNSGYGVVLVDVPTEKLVESIPAPVAPVVVPITPSSPVINSVGFKGILLNLLGLNK